MPHDQVKKMGFRYVDEDLCRRVTEQDLDWEKDNPAWCGRPESYVVGHMGVERGDKD